MNLYPAIDIKDGQFIRLKKGDLSEVTVYGDDPLKQAKKFQSLGAKWIHIVDIDGAFKGESKNISAILNIKKGVKCKIQVGGGIREIKTIEKLIENRVDRIVLGTIALTDPAFVKDVCNKFPNRIAIGLDTRDGFVATEGWVKNSKVKFNDFIKMYEDSKVSAIIFTDIDKDGLMEGANYKQLEDLLNITKLNVIASGGISSLDDLRRLKRINAKNLIGVISGKAIYEEKFKVNEAIKILED